MLVKEFGARLNRSTGADLKEEVFSEVYAAAVNWMEILARPRQYDVRAIKKSLELWMRSLGFRMDVRVADRISVPVVCTALFRRS